MVIQTAGFPYNTFVAYLSLYRKYRSQGFDEILGQKHVTQTLKNALGSGSVAHAYLFTGPRGTGKTSTARVLAKALNCRAGDGPTAEPCGVCEACVRIRDGHSMDVMEIDAASTRGIDDIRDLREKVKFAPAEERVKVYVIDEVHQLTGEAFNALLKTLEEPPANVVFVLATTELHKVPATILSRCQRFDFRRGSLADLKERVATVCTAEGWGITPDAVGALAVGANGGYRDALSLLEQVAAYTSGQAEIDLEAVHVVLGSVADEQLLAAVDAISSQDAAACFRVVAEALAAGVEARQFLTGLRRRLRDLLMLAVGAATEDTGLPDSLRERLEAHTKTISTADLLWAMDQLNEAERDLRWAPQPRLLLESVLVKIATRAQAVAAPVVLAAAPAARPRPEAAAPPREAPPERPYSIVQGGLRDEESPPMEAPPVNLPPAAEGMGEFTEAWNTLVHGLKGGARQVVKGMYPLRVDRGILHIAGPTEMFVEQANGRRQRMEEAFQQALGRPMPLKFVHVASDDAPPEAPPAKRAAPEPAPSPAAPPPLSDLAAEVFQADIIGNDEP
jgi:DNA polymerase-3 subunit gamma/tau